MDAQTQLTLGYALLTVMLVFVTAFSAGMIITRGR